MAGVINKEAVVLVQRAPVLAERAENVVSGGITIQQQVSLKSVALTKKLVDSLGIGNRGLQVVLMLIGVNADDQRIVRARRCGSGRPRHAALRSLCPER